jgi:hypothetical protein
MKKNYYIITATFSRVNVIFPFTYEFTSFNLGQFRSDILDEGLNELEKVYVLQAFKIKREDIGLQINLVHSEIIDNSNRW